MYLPPSNPEIVPDKLIQSHHPNPVGVHLTTSKAHAQQIPKMLTERLGDLPYRALLPVLLPPLHPASFAQAHHYSHSYPV